MRLWWICRAFACLLFLALSPHANSQTPELTGPVSGGAHRRPFASSLADLAAAGYVEEEYFFSGTATSYTFSAHAAPDGLWTVAPADRQPYKTRLLVRRPKDPAKFNGTVVLEWLNVSGGFDIDAEWGYAYPELMRDGFVWVGVSAQRAGVMGPPLRAGFSQPLTLWDAPRYGSLLIPGDEFSYDIFTQAAHLVAPGRPALSPDPLAGLDVQRVLGVGVSQSANRLVTYADAVQQVANALDGILIGSRIGSSGGAAPLRADPLMPDPVKIRGDLKIPILVTETESDAPSHFPARTADSARYRLWELAGTTHQNQWADAYFGAEIKRDLGVSGLGSCDHPVNDLPTQHVADAAIKALDLWMRDGQAPAIAPRIAISGSPPVIQRDAAGNALGGLRLPRMAVPVARYGGVGTPDACRLGGVAIPFDKETLKKLYPTHAIYVAKIKDAVVAAEKAGFLLPPEGADEIRKAEAAAIP
jgi:hypothetical protein